MIENVIFDMGGVLLDFDPERFVARLGLNGADSAILVREVFRSIEWVCVDRGSLTEDEAFASMCTRIPQRLHAAAREVFENWDKPRLPLENIYDTVRELSERGYGLYLFSNAGRRHQEYWPDLPVSKFFGDRLMVSAWWQLLKPEAAFYEKGFERFGLDPAKCVFIDDSPTNLEGARRVGLDGIVYHGDVPLLRQRLREKGVNI